MRDEAVKVVINANGSRDNVSKELGAFLDFLLGKKNNGRLSNELDRAVSKAREHKEWRHEYMTLNMKLAEEREEGRIEGRFDEVISSIVEGDYSLERGAEKLGMSIEELKEEIEKRGIQLDNN